MPRKTMRAALLAALLATSSALAALPALRTSSHAPRCRVARCVQAGEAPPLEPASADSAAAAATPPRSLLGQASEAADAVYRFSRPHTIRGTLLACFTGVARALIESPVYLALLPALMPRAALGVLALLLGNLFIVGINQIYDVEIDVINKPFLPIAAGRISPRAAWWLVVCSGLTGLAIVVRRGGLGLNPITITTATTLQRCCPLV